MPRFVDLGMVLGADDSGDARGVAVADFDNDGDLDLAVNHNPGDSGIAERGRATLLVNDVGHEHGWLAVELEGTQSNRDAIGALVTLEAGGHKRVRQVEAGSGYASQHGRRLYFGLGNTEKVDRLTVRWPSGLEEQVLGAEPRRLVRIREGLGAVVEALPLSARQGG